MKDRKHIPILQAAAAAVLFGIATPVSKLLLQQTEPVPLAAFLYLGSGAGLLLYVMIRKMITRNGQKEAPLTKKEVPWLLGAVLFGGIIAPIVLMWSLKSTPASTASLLLNFECAATSLLAVLLFRESIGRRTALAIAAITIASIILSWDSGNRWGISLGALGVLVTCVCWGIDNNFTRNISLKNPFTIVIIKGLAAGVFSMLLALLLGIGFPKPASMGLAMLLGFFSYGLSIVLFVLAMRQLGSARTSAIFGGAPFVGALVSFIVFRSLPGIEFLLSLPLMAVGIILIILDNHEHEHTHEHLEHDHKHDHTDGHHGHAHGEGAPDGNAVHAHPHTHESLKHAHRHYPDTHHRH